MDRPLTPFAYGLRKDLAGQGFATTTIVDHVYRLADLSGWPSARYPASDDVLALLNELWPLLSYAAPDPAHPPDHTVNPPDAA